ncbi:MAG: metallophosphoesterase family protein [Candidatus Thorarchaeota archaeon]|jgi:predicted phosphodiesterase
MVSLQFIPRPLTIAIVIILIGFVPLSIGSTQNKLDGVGPLQTEYNDFNFIAYGDTRGQAPDYVGISPIHEDIVNAYVEESPELILHTGDIVGSGGVYEQWTSFNDSMTAVWEGEIPFYGSAGNHEKYTDVWYQYDSDLSNYTTFFDYSSVVDEPGETELYFSFDYEGIHFIILNTEDYFDDVEFGSDVFNCSEEQMTWLLGDLAGTEPEDFIVVVFHRPPWSIREGRPDRWDQAETVRAEFHDIFVQNDVDIVFNGHDHYYYRTLRDDIYYVITGGGGAELYEPSTTAPIWQSGDVATSQYHYCNVVVNSTHVKIDVLTIDDTIIDSFTLSRLTETTPTTTPTGTVTPPPIPMEMFAVVIVGVAVVIGVILLVQIRRR